MHSKSFTFGIGTGMIIVALLFYMIYSLDGRSARAADQNTATIKDEDVISRARLLGMAFLNELQTPPPVKDAPPSDSEIIARAEALGMSFLDRAKETDTTVIPPPTETVPLPPEPESHEPSEPESGFADDSEVEIFIPFGSYATDISDILFEVGVIDSIEEFTDYLYQTGATRSLREGAFIIPMGADYQEITRILMRKSK